MRIWMIDQWLEKHVKKQVRVALSPEDVQKGYLPCDHAENFYVVVVPSPRRSRSAGFCLLPDSCRHRANRRFAPGSTHRRIHRPLRSFISARARAS